ncbi:f1f0 atp synthase assembly protein [Ophiostoma piceae UAMH 11346]|uniref:F1f0 atp synthase assembly protein n=1 Tax=Ophiostoma piceae (strain UAMH 11346) TaxID=1262450 RepID=S3CE70_OPHP1|nr:f1f0 atp synthase assembly protein [Ophiostoma piceae UAMH 11346]
MASSGVASASRAMRISSSLRAASVRYSLRTPCARGQLTYRVFTHSHTQARPASTVLFSSKRLYSTDSSDASSTPKPAKATPTSPTANEVLERYRSKLESKAKKDGVESIEVLKETYADKIKAIRRRDAVLPEGATTGMKPLEAKKVEEAVEAAALDLDSEVSSAASSPAGSASSTPASSRAASPSPVSSNTHGARPLSSLLDLEKVRTLPIEELTAIWRLRFAHDPLSLCAVIPAQTYAAMEAAARARPQFVVPVPHPERGAEIHFLQWTFDAGQQGTPPSTVLFTQLAEYKLRNEYAQPHTTVSHYTDLAVDCGVVLMHGQVADGRGVTADHAQWLVMCLQRFYGAWAIPGTPGAPGIDEGARARRLLLQWFAAGDPQFSIDKLMEEVEKLV